MRKTILSVLLIFAFFVSTGFTQDRKMEQIDILLVQALSEAIMYSPKYSDPAMKEAIIKAGIDPESKIAVWEKSADNSPLNQYRRGYFYYIKGYEKGETGHFIKALPYLKEAKKKGLKETGLDDMIEMCEMNDAERKKKINEKNASNDKIMEEMISRR